MQEGHVPRPARAFHDAVPTEGEILELMASWRLPAGIKDHSLVVRDIALHISARIKAANPGMEIDDRVLEAGALLHDIGRVETHGLDHGVAGWRLLRAAGVDERVARCAMVHVLGGFTREDIKGEFPRDARDIDQNIIPESIEEKIVCLADKHAYGTTRVSLKRRFSRWFKKHGRTQFLLKSRYRVLQIEKELELLTGEPGGDGFLGPA